MSAQLSPKVLWSTFLDYRPIVMQKDANHWRRVEYDMRFDFDISCAALRDPGSENMQPPPISVPGIRQQTGLTAD
jgi:hypothetical protein